MSRFPLGLQTHYFLWLGHILQCEKGRRTTYIHKPVLRDISYFLLLMKSWLKKLGRTMQDPDKGDDLDPECLPLTLILHELNRGARYSRRNRMRRDTLLDLNSHKQTTGRWAVMWPISCQMVSRKRKSTALPHYSSSSKRFYLAWPHSQPQTQCCTFFSFKIHSITGRIQWMCFALWKCVWGWKGL